MAVTTDTATEEEPETPAPAPIADEPEFGESDRIAITAKQVVYNSISGDIHAGAAVFGIGAQTRRATGTITRDRLEAALAGFVRPDGLSRAARVLRRNRVVVLHGSEGDGKYTAALKLLSEVCGEAADAQLTLTSISPATTLAQLGAGMKYREGRGYLVADLVDDGSAAQVREHDLRALASVLSRAGAYLVITSTGPDLREQSLPEFVTDLPSPDPSELFRNLPGTAELAEDVRTAALDQVRHLRPREVVALAAHLRDDPENALGAFHSEARQQVAEWVEKTSLRREIFEVTIAALFGELPEPAFEDLVARLLVAGDPMPPVPPPADQVLRRRNREHPLLVATGREGTGGSGRRVGFRLREHRALALEALYDEFGYQLWDPVRRWLVEVGELGLSPHGEGELAAGLALLARHDFADVRKSFLEPWAAGSVSERSLAALVLWFMSDDDGAAPLALSTAMGWGDRQGTAKALTSATALGGPLGLRYPAEAMQRLCFLALRSKRIGEAAGVSLASLLASAAEAGAPETGDVLATVARELVSATNRKVLTGAVLPEVAATVADPLGDAPETADGDTYEKGVGIRVLRAARRLVVTLLSASRVSVAEPVATVVLREQPGNIPLLGALWADVLCSAPHRADAIRALRRALKALENTDDVQDAVVTLGSAIQEAMPVEHRQLRSDELRRLLSGGAQEVHVTTLLRTLGGLTPISLPRSRRPRGEL
jgi:hypothetical protein